jgi:hypothetical protein
MMMGRPDAVVFNLTKGVSILVNREGEVISKIPKDKPIVAYCT